MYIIKVNFALWASIFSFEFPIELWRKISQLSNGILFKEIFSREPFEKIETWIIIDFKPVKNRKNSTKTISSESTKPRLLNELHPYCKWRVAHIATKPRNPLIPTRRRKIWTGRHDRFQCTCERYFLNTEQNLLKP